MRYMNKRLTGLMSLALKRKAAHPVQIAERLVADMLEMAPDHVLITGDLTNLSLEPEFERARSILEPLASKGMLSVIPGNHDIYTRGAEKDDRFESYFGDLLWEGDVPAKAERYPWHRQVGDVHIVGFCSAVPRAPIMANGLVHPEQFARLATLSQEHGFEDAFVVAMVHHNVHPRGWRKDVMHGLDNRDAFLTALKDGHVDMLLHGHTHVAHRFRQDDLAIVGCGSSTWSSDHPSHVARYNLYEIENGRLQRMTARVFDLTEDRFQSAGPLEIP